MSDTTIENVRLGILDADDILATIATLTAERDAAIERLTVATRKVICCGVAATNPNAELTRMPPYSTIWDSPQAEDVRRLRAERDALRAIVDKLPRTADVVPVVPSMDEVYVLDDRGRVWSTPIAWHNQLHCYWSTRGYGRTVGECYSTREAAAEAARKAGA